MVQEMAASVGRGQSWHFWSRLKYLISLLVGVNVRVDSLGVRRMIFLIFQQVPDELFVTVHDPLRMHRNDMVALRRVI